MGMNDVNSLSHSKWNCKYHIVFAPKYRRKVFYKERRAAIGKILRQLCEWKGVEKIFKLNKIYFSNKEREKSLKTPKTTSILSDCNK